MMQRALEVEKLLVGRFVAKTDRFKGGVVSDNVQDAGFDASSVLFDVDLLPARAERNVETVFELVAPP